MERKLKVGDSFRVFKIINDCFDSNLVGKFFVERNDEFKGNKYGVEANISIECLKTIHFNIPYHVKPIGKLTITKLKNP